LIFIFIPSKLPGSVDERGSTAMIVCHCNGVSDRAIRRSVRAGAVTPELVARACGAGACCGGCRGAVQEVLFSELQTATSSADSQGSEVSAGR
jgi:bacterioferritin-associated ferredoxin